MEKKTKLNALYFSFNWQRFFFFLKAQTHKKKV